jgi:hypothetical protein
VRARLQSDARAEYCRVQPRPAAVSVIGCAGARRCGS